MLKKRVKISFRNKRLGDRVTSRYSLRNSERGSKLGSLKSSCVLPQTARERQQEILVASSTAVCLIIVTTQHSDSEIVSGRKLCAQPYSEPWKIKGCQNVIGLTV